METSKDPEQVAKDLGIDIYPGATALKNGAVNMSFGSMHTVAASFESTDSVDKICDLLQIANCQTPRQLLLTKITAA